MRVIKFRAWAHANKVMFYPNTGDGWELLGGRLNALPNTTLMQYTSLKDKNGKEIYEGDIIEGKHPHKGRYHKGVVEYIEWRFTMKCFFWGHLDIGNEPFCEGTEYWQVIGNIYENPELLK
jgi:uncharacterized phage protein (TIGR01671 family)